MSKSASVDGGKNTARRQSVPVPRNISLNVTQPIIDESVAKDSKHCMIAQALRYIGASATHVTSENASFNFGGFRYTYPLPATAAAKLIKFDEDKTKVKPFAVRLSANVGFVRPIKYRPDAKPSGAAGTASPATRRKYKGKPRPKRLNVRNHGLSSIKVPA